MPVKRPARARGQRHVVPMPGQEKLGPGMGDHGCIIRTKRQRGGDELCPVFRGNLFQRGANGGVCRNTARDTKCRASRRSRKSASGFFGKNITDRPLKSGAKIGSVLSGQPRFFRHDPVAFPQQRRLEAGKRKIASRTIQQGARKGEPPRIPVFCRMFHHRAAGLRQTQKTRCLVKSLARCVIYGAAQAGETVAPLDQKKLTMPTGHKQHEVRIGQTMRQPRGQGMAGKVIDAHQRQPPRGGNAFGAHHTRQNAADQPRPGGHRDSIKRIKPDIRLVQCLLHADIQLFGVGTRCDLGHDPAEIRMKIRLPLHDGGQDMRHPVHKPQNGRRGIVAAAFKSEDRQCRGHRPARCTHGQAQVTPEERANNCGECMPPPVLITRPAAPSGTLVQDLQARLGPNCRIVLSPLLRIEPVSAHVDDHSIRTVIFTSAHAVTHYTSLTDRRDVTCYTVGPATAQVARNAGFAPISGKGTGQALVAQIKADMPPAPCLYLRGDHIAFDIAKALNAAGLETHSRVVYRQVPQPLTSQAQRLLSGSARVIVPLFSPRSAALFFAQGPFTAPLDIVAISENVTQLVSQAGRNVCVTASHPNQPAMLDAVYDLWVTANRLEGRDPAQ